MNIEIENLSPEDKELIKKISTSTLGVLRLELLQIKLMINVIWGSFMMALVFCPPLIYWEITKWREWDPAYGWYILSFVIGATLFGMVASNDYIQEMFKKLYVDKDNLKFMIKVKKGKILL